MADDAGATARARDDGPRSLKAHIEVAGQSIRGDEPVAAGGTGTGPAPHDLLSAGLAECTALTVRLYADRKEWPLQGVEVEVRHEVDPAANPRSLFRRTVRLTGPLDAEQKARLIEIAERCPVHRTLTSGSRIETSAVD